MPRWEDQVLDEYQRPVPGALVHVFTNDGVTRVVLTADDGLPLDNPVETDTYGSFYFNVAVSGVYQLEVHYAGETEYKQTIYVGLYNVPDGSITTPKIADGAVTSAKIADGTIATIDLANDSVTMAKLANVAPNTVFYRKSAGAGDPETQTLATLKTDLGLSGVNTGDQTITLTGDVTGSGTGSFAATIAAGAVTTAKLAPGAVTLDRMANVAAAPCFLGKSTAGAGPVDLVAPSEVNALLPLFTSASKGLAPQSGGGTVNFLRADGSWAAPPGAASGAVWGQITGTLSNQTDLQTALNGKAALVHTHAIADVTGLQPALDGKASLAHTHVVADVTGLQAALDSKAGTALVSTSAAGLAPTRPGGTTAFLRADGTWAVPAGGGGGIPEAPTDGQVYSRRGSDASWQVSPSGGGGSVAWGAITGTLSAQTDLQAALDGKADDADLTGKANLAGGNSFTGNQGVAGNVTLTGSGVLQAVAISSSGNISAGGTITASSNMVCTNLTAAANVNLADEAYSSAWDGKLQAPTKNAVYDQMQLKANASALAGYLPLTGGTVTGNLTVNGTIGSLSDISTSASVISTKSISSDLIVRGSGAEGGQLTLGYKDQTAITGGGNSTWNVDVASNNELRIYRLNAAGEAAIPISIDETAATLSSGCSTIWLNANKLLLQHTGGHGYIRTQEGNLSLGGGGNNQLVLTAAGGVTVDNTLGVGGVLTLSHATSPTLILGSGPIARISGSGSTLILRAEAHHWERESGGATQADLSPAGLFTANEFQSLSHITTLGINYIKGVGPTQWWWDTDSRTFAIHVNGDTAYFMRGGTNDPQWAALPNGKWPMQLNLETGAFDTGAGIAAAGNIYAQTDRRCYQQGSPGIGPGAEIFMAATAPTSGDGNNGDIWLQYV